MRRWEVMKAMQSDTSKPWEGGNTVKIMGSHPEKRIERRAWSIHVQEKLWPDNLCTDNLCTESNDTLYWDTVLCRANQSLWDPAKTWRLDWKFMNYFHKQQREAIITVTEIVVSCTQKMHLVKVMPLLYNFRYFGCGECGGK